VVRCAKRAILARIWSAVFVHTKGLGSVLWASMKVRMASSSSATLRCTPRRTCLVVSSANQRSTKFSHEPYVGVKCPENRGRLANQRWIREVLCGALSLPPPEDRDPARDGEPEASRSAVIAL
jgi:hypothetical protein